jgi:hypothetical protein
MCPRYEGKPTRPSLEGSEQDLAAGRVAARSAAADTQVSNFAGWRAAHEPPLCAPILVDCLGTGDAPNGLIGVGWRLAGLKL